MTIFLLLLLAPDVGELEAVLKRYAAVPQEQARREEAVRALGRIGTKESTRVLEAVLADPYPHLRDEAVSALVALRHADPPQRAASVALLGEFLGRRSDPETRRLLATALGLLGDPAAVPALAAALGDERDAAVAEALAGALGRLGSAPGLAPLQEKAQAMPGARAACVRALGGIEGGADLARAWKDDPDDAVRAAVVDACGRVYDDLEVGPRTGGRLAIALLDALPPARDAAVRRRAGDLLAHPDWRVRAAAIATVVRLRDPALLPDLVTRLGEEEGRLRIDAWNALRALTGREYPPDPDRWRALPTALPAAGPAPGLPDAPAVCFGLPVLSRRVAFVWDGGADAKARAELAASLRRLAPGVRYDLFACPAPAEPVRPAPVRCFGRLETGATAAGRWLAARPPAPGALYDALRAALLDPEVDTIVLVSAGEPARGTLTRPHRILEEVRALDRWQRVTIHAVHTGGAGAGRKLLRDLAAATGGVAVDAAGRPLG